MVANSYRFPFIVVFIGFSLSIISVYTAGEVYPFAPGVIALAVLVLCGVQFYRNEYTGTYLLGYLLLSTFHRVFLYSYPSSFIAADSDGFAAEIARLLFGGSLSAISSGFYSEAPIFIITGQTLTTIFDNSLRVGLVFPAVMIGLLYPLIGFIVPRYLPISNQTQVSYLSAAITVLAPYSIRFTNNPIPQTQSVVLTLLGIILLGMYTRERSSTFLFLILFFLFTVLITHKLAPYIITLAFIFIASISFLHRTPKKIETIVGVLGIIMFIGIYLQSILTGFDQVVSFKILELFGIGGTTPEPAGSGVESFTSNVAEPPISEELRLLLQRSHTVLMFSLAGIGWLILFCKTYYALLARIFDTVRSNSKLGPIRAEIGSQVDSQSGHVSAKLQDSGPSTYSSKRATSIFTGIILFIVVLETTIVIGILVRYIPEHTERFILLMTPILAVLIAIFIIRLSNHEGMFKQKHRTILAAILFFLFIVSQAISPAASYDDPTHSRFYLTDSELSGKIWGLAYLQGPIATDNWLANEQPPSKIKEYVRSNKRLPSRYKGVNPQILNGTLAQGSHCNIMLRPSVSRYSYQGQWKLNHPVTQGFEGYHQVYSNGGGIAVFQSPDCRSLNEE